MTMTNISLVPGDLYKHSGRVFLSIEDCLEHLDANNPIILYLGLSPGQKNYHRFLYKDKVVVYAPRFLVCLEHASVQ